MPQGCACLLGEWAQHPKNVLYPRCFGASLLGGFPAGKQHLLGMGKRETCRRGARAGDGCIYISYSSSSCCTTNPAALEICSSTQYLEPPVCRKGCGREAVRACPTLGSAGAALQQGGHGAGGCGQRGRPLPSAAPPYRQRPRLPLVVQQQPGGSPLAVVVALPPALLLGGDEEALAAVQQPARGAAVWARGHRSGARQPPAAPPRARRPAALPASRQARRLLAARSPASRRPCTSCSSLWAPARAPETRASSASCLPSSSRLLLPSRHARCSSARACASSRRACSRLCSHARASCEKRPRSAACSRDVSRSSRVACQSGEGLG